MITLVNSQTVATRAYSSILTRSIMLHVVLLPGLAYIYTNTQKLKENET